MAYTINYEGDSTDHLAAFVALLAKDGAGAWVFKLTWRDSTGDPVNTADVGIVHWDHRTKILRVRPWPESASEFPADDGEDRGVDLDDIAEVHVY